MNKIEKLVYDAVKANPSLKNLVRNFYQNLFDLLPKKKEYFLTTPEYKEGYFFGFHDVSPFSFDGTKLLANKPDVFLKMPNKSDALKVGYFGFNEGKILSYHQLDISYAWNHHKGCRLQWLGDNSIIFNTAIDEQLVAKIINIADGNSFTVDYPIDSTSSDGKFATSFSYQRLNTLMPGYGYIYDDDSFLDVNAPNETGIFLIDIENNSKRLLISLKQLSQNSQNEPGSIESRHYVTHSAFSHDGRYVSFLHRWVGENVIKRWSRLIIYDLEEESYLVLPTEQMVSHYVWNNLNQIIAYCRIDGVDCHALFNVPDTHNYKKVAYPSLNSDGHQSFITDNSFITDTYPDKYRMAKLYRVNSETDEVALVASVYSPKKYQTKSFYKHIACDLHPRVSPDGKYISIDTARTGKRSLCIMPLINNDTK